MAHENQNNSQNYPEQSENPYSGPDFFTGPEPDREGYEERRLAAAFAQHLYEESQHDQSTSAEDQQKYRNLAQFMAEEATRFGIQENIIPPPSPDSQQT
jgi:hypothetical protein